MRISIKPSDIVLSSPAHLFPNDDDGDDDDDHDHDELFDDYFDEDGDGDGRLLKNFVSTLLGL